MKRNFFGEARFEPDDDLFAAWNDEFCPDDPEFYLYASCIEEDDEFGWSCALSDDEGNESEAQGFESEEQLREWLGEYRMNIDG